MSDKPSDPDAVEDQTMASRYDPTVAERRWYAEWEEAGFFSPDHPRVDPAAKTYSIVIPPPNVTGSLHMGHALTVTIEDTLVRWRRMQGHRTLWLPGTDHAGIATQMVVERQLQQEEGKTRHDIGRSAFIERVWQWKRQYGDRISEQERVLGCSLDWSRDRFTMDEDLNVAVREAFVRLFDDGLIYRAERLVNWCPRCHTALSDLEVEHDENVQGELWSFAYPLAEPDANNKELVVATTRPETMLGDTGVAVHPDDPRYQHLIGQHVRHPLFGYLIPIVGDAELVDPEFGTGAVKVTPAHDFNDFETGKRHELTLFNIFDENAKVVPSPEVSDDIKNSIADDKWQTYAGLDRREARKKVKMDLAALGLERGSQAHNMALGACQRCQTIVEPSLSIQWWVKTEPLAAPALEAVKSGATRIIPEGWTKTYYHWLENIQDWCISRQLWWGHRIPAWYCLSCSPSKGQGEQRTFASGAKPMVSRQAPAACLTCGGTDLVQDNDVLDTWFSSGLWPFSTLGWPNGDSADLKAFYPNSVMETGFDILFFWIARMMMMGCKFMGQPPFPVIYLHAMVRDKRGDKMSKVRGNVIDPLHLIHGCGPEQVSDQFRDEYPDGFPAFGADALRFSLAAMSGSGRDIKLNIERIAGYRAFANKIWNAARFVLMRIGNEKPRQLVAGDTTVVLQPADRFILSRLAAATEATNEGLEAFRFADAASTVYQFIWSEFCDWYIELVKPRLFAEAEEAAAERRAAASTLVFVLDHALRLLHPMMPYITEEIWQRLPIDRRPGLSPAAGPATIMFGPYPQTSALAAFRDEGLEEEYRAVQSAIVGIRTVRSESNVPPSKEVGAVLLTDDAALGQTLADHHDEIVKLARLSDLQLSTTAEYQRPTQAAVKVIEGLEIVVPLAGIIDFAKEVDRLEKAIAKSSKERDKLQAKLANRNFVARAPQEIVAKDRARAEELGTMLDSLSESLSRAQAAVASPPNP